MEAFFLENHPSSPCEGTVTKSGFERMEAFPSNSVYKKYFLL